jgi:hypothetical protein
MNSLLRWRSLTRAWTFPVSSHLRQSLLSTSAAAVIQGALSRFGEQSTGAWHSMSRGAPDPAHGGSHALVVGGCREARQLVGVATRRPIVDGLKRRAHLGRTHIDYFR